MHTTTAITTPLKVGICGLFWNKSTLNPNWTGQTSLVLALKVVIIVKKMLPKVTIIWKKNSICQIFHQWKIQKVLIKIDKMADVFLNSTYFSQHSLLTLAPPSGYSLNLKALIKVSNSAEHLSFHTKYCDLHLKEHSEIKEKLKKHLPKALVQLRLS